jgi:hypothetical protein
MRAWWLNFSFIEAATGADMARKKTVASTMIEQ